MKFDIESLKRAAQSSYDVVVGTREDGSPVGFTVVGQGSEQFARAERAVQVMNIMDISARKASVDSSTEDGAVMVYEGSQKRQRVILQECVIRWYGLTNEDGSDFPLTPENLQLVLTIKPQWMEQLMAAINNEANFAPG